MSNLYADPVKILVVAASEEQLQNLPALPQNNSLNLQESADLQAELAPTNYMELELYPHLAPNTVKNFISLVKKGFYDGLIFHRVIKGFMIQGGCPEGTGMGGPGYCIKGEFRSNNYQNPLQHERGVISMARAMSPDSAGSQFFIMHAAAPHLDGQYAAFGRLVGTTACLDRIAETQVDYQDRPLQNQVMSHIYVVGNVDLGEPEKI